MVVFELAHGQCPQCRSRCVLFCFGVFSACLLYGSSCDRGDRSKAQPDESKGMCFSFGTLEMLLGLKPDSVSLDAAYIIASNSPHVLVIRNNSYYDFCLLRTCLLSCL